MDKPDRIKQIKAALVPLVPYARYELMQFVALFHQFVDLAEQHATALATLRMRLTVHFKLITRQNVLIAAQNRTIERQIDQIGALRAQIENLWDVHGNAMCVSNETLNRLDGIEARVLDLEQRKVVTEDELGRQVGRTLRSMHEHSRYADPLNFVIEE